MIKQDISENRVNISYLSIGSNLGNKKRNIEKAKYLLEKNQVKITDTTKKEVEKALKIAKLINE